MAKRILSGMQPTGVGLTLGNYLGALKPWVDSQHEAENFFVVVDHHAITMPQKTAEFPVGSPRARNEDFPLWTSSICWLRAKIEATGGVLSQRNRRFEQMEQKTTGIGDSHCQDC